MRENKTVDLASAMDKMGLEKNNTPPSDKQIEQWFINEQEAFLEKDFTPQIEGLTKRFAKADFSNFEPYTTELKHNVKVCKDFPSSDKNCLIMNGKVGTGKTHLAISTMKNFPKQEVGGHYSEYEGKRKWIKHYRAAKCLFLSFYEFIDELEDARNMGKKAHRIYYYMQNDCICLDDLRIEDLTVSVKRNLFSLINGVYDNRKKFILTTNASFDEIEKYDPRIADRLYENGIAIAFTNNSYRRK